MVRRARLIGNKDKYRTKIGCKIAKQLSKLRSFMDTLMPEIDEGITSKEAAFRWGCCFKVAQRRLGEMTEIGLAYRKARWWIRSPKFS